MKRYLQKILSKKILLRVFSFFLLLSLVGSCATYYQSNYNFNKEFERGNLHDALNTLQTASGDSRSSRQFLFFVNNGLVLSMMGRYKDSNEYFEKAFLFGEDYRKNYLYEAASYLANPTITPYRGEDHEHLMLLYYKALNFLKMGDTEAALVECRRLNIRLQQLSDRYQSENKYQRDAFVHNLMGIIYEVDRDYNNAFIAYRNAIEIYEDDYQRLFSMSAPEQLKEDLLRTAWLSGMTEEFAQFKEKFNMPDYQYAPTEGGELVFFWHNGLSPVKGEWGLNFVVNRRDDWVYFYNPEMNLSFPFRLDGYSDQDKQGLSNLEVFRVVFPRYIARPVYYQGASISVNGSDHPLHLMEDINKIAFKGLEQRMNLEFAKALIRVAIKKATEYEVRKEDKNLGSLLGVINAITEKADTRNWQILPHSIYYTRVRLPVGQNQVALQLSGPGSPAKHDFTYQIKPGQILFHTFSSLETGSPTYGY